MSGQITFAMFREMGPIGALCIYDVSGVRNDGEITLRTGTAHWTKIKADHIEDAVAEFERREIESARKSPVQSISYELL